MKPKQLHQLYSEMAKLTGAGFPVAKAAETLLSQHESGPTEVFARSLKESLEQGLSIRQSIDKVPLPISELEKSVIGAAEKGGQLEQGFNHLADYFHLLQETRGQIFRNAIYPLVMIHIAIPLSALISSTFSEQSFWSVLVIRFAFVYILGGIILFGALYLIKAARTSKPIDRFLGALPVVGKARRAMSLTRFCKVFHIHLLSGGNISEGVALAGNAAQSAGLTSSALRMVPQIQSGNPLGPLMIVNRHFPKDFSRSIMTAEESGELDTEMSRWAQYMHSSAVASMHGLGDWLPKILYFATMLFVGYLIITGYQQYIDTAMGILNGADL